MNYSSVHKFTSQIPAFAGVTFVLRKQSEARRAQLRLMTAESQNRIRNLVSESQKLKAQPEESRDVVRIAAITDEIETEVIQGLNPVWLKWGVKSIQGLFLKDDDNPEAEPVAIETPEQLVANGPSELMVEILGTLKALAGMSEDEIKNYALPSTSGAQTDGSVRNTSASVAESVVSSAPETAHDSTAS